MTFVARKNLERPRALACREVRAALAQALGRLSDLGPLHEAMAREATEWQRPGPHDPARFPLLAAEADRSGRTTAAVAAAWAAADLAWRAQAAAALVDAAIGEAAVQSATNLPAMTAAAEAAKTALANRGTPPPQRPQPKRPPRP